MDLINDLGTDLAFAILVEQRYRQKIDSNEALALISRIRTLLEDSRHASKDGTGAAADDGKQALSAH